MAAVLRKIILLYEHNGQDYNKNRKRYIAGNISSKSNKYFKGAEKSFI